MKGMKEGGGSDVIGNELFYVIAFLIVTAK